MQIILLSSFCKKVGGIDLCQPRFFAPGLLLTGLFCGGLAYLGYCVGAATAVDAGFGEVAETADAAFFELRRDLLRQREELERSRLEAEEQIDTLAIRLGQMQAHIFRLDALGDRLTEMANFDNGEFDFSQPPAQGGPDVASESRSLEVPDFLRLLDQVAQQIEDREHQLVVLETLLRSRNLQAEVRPAGRPVKAGWMSSSYGERIHPLTGKKHHHRGVDFAGKTGTEVVAVASGVVTRSGMKNDYGKIVEITHGNGYTTRYAHNQENLVAVGEIVKQGQVIARMGSTGRSTGPHVHFEVIHNGRSVDPSKYIRAAR